MFGRDDILAGYRGHVDAVEPVLSGWVSRIASPHQPVTLFLSIDGGSPVRVIADRARPDVAAAGLAGQNCGFSVDLPAHLFDGQRLNLPGNPLCAALGPVRADIVPAAAASVEAVATLLRRSNFEAGFDPDLVHAAHAAAFNAMTSPAQGFLFYARAGHRLVGYGRLDRGGDAVAFGVVALTVLAAYRRKGLGEALLRALLRAAAAAELREVWLSVRPDNTPALRLYEKLGFVRDASHPPGRWAVPGEMTMVWLPRSVRKPA
jgi:ribosomal protein S18 acetylase RimI-like enzyme